MKESNIQKLIQLALSDAGLTFWRNETAGAWVGHVVYQDANTVTLKNPRMIQAGLCKGGSDLVGVAPGGLFAAIEVKTHKGRTTIEQDNFIEVVRDAGGVAGVARSVDEALRVVYGK